MSHQQQQQRYNTEQQQHLQQQMQHQQQQQQQMQQQQQHHAQTTSMNSSSSSSPTLLPPTLLNAIDKLVDRLNASSGYDILHPTTPPPIYALLIGTNEGVALSRSFGTLSPSTTSTTFATSSTPPTHPGAGTASSHQQQRQQYQALPMSEEILSSVETAWATLPSASPPHVMAAAAAAAATEEQLPQQRNSSITTTTTGGGTEVVSGEGGHRQPPHPLLRHLGMGEEVRVATAFYDSCTLLHVHMAPLVVTILTSPDANIGSIRSVALPLLTTLLQPVKSAINTSRRAAATAAANGIMANGMHLHGHHHSGMAGYYHG